MLTPIKLHKTSLTTLNSTTSLDQTVVDCYFQEGSSINTLLSIGNRLIGLHVIFQSNL